ncbi:MAG: alpha/beta hydrolase family protein [Alkalimonas sp.]|nr:alpha/beta hydrolase family protein [Alkalimonas sp.]
MYRFCVYTALLLLLIYLPSSQLQANEQQTIADLQRQLPEWEFKQISNEQDTFTIIHRPAMTAFEKGTLILIPDASLHPATPRQLNFLRQAFNDLGWHTIALMPPSSPTNEQNSSEPLQQRLNLLLSDSEMPSGHLVVLAQGSSASLLTQLDWLDMTRQADALILLSSYEADPAINRELAQRIGALTIPTLDIAHHQDHPHIQQTLIQRQQWSRKNANLLYRQRLLSGHAELETTQQLMYKEVYGWLSYLGL